MKSKIKFIRAYEFYNLDCIDVVYYSGRVKTYTENDKIPGTVKDFIILAPRAVEQYDKTFKRMETIYC